MSGLPTGRCGVLAAPLLALALGAFVPAGAAAAPARGSPLALPLLGDGGRPELVLAQRAVERSWGPSEDSTYVEVSVPGWRAEGWAAALSGAVPGAGHAYVGEGGGIWFALAEVAGWVANRIYLHRAHDERDRSERFVGDPYDTTSAWSFARWSQASGLEPVELEQVWARDRQAFYELIAREPAYLAGWKGDPAATRGDFYDLRGLSRAYYRRATQVGYALWANHLLAAFDALRAARSHNLPLRPNLELRLRSSWRRGGPVMAATLVRSF